MHQVAQPQYLEASTSLVARVRPLVEALAAGAAGRDSDRILPYAEMDLVRQAGVPGMRVGVEHGGPDLSFAEFAEVMRLLGAGDANVAQAIQPHFFLVEHLRLDGTPEQKERYCREMRSGAIFANAFAERGGGVVGQVRTRLTRDGDGWRLDGTKYYSTGSLFADYLYSNAVCEDGIAVLAIFPRNRAGVTVTDDWDGMGQRTTASGTTELKGVHIETDEIIPLPYLGKKRIYIGAAAQLAHAAIDAGIAQAALTDAVAYAPKARPVPESRVERASDDAYVIHAIGEMAVLVHTAEAMLTRAGDILDRAASLQLLRKINDAEVDQALSEASIAVAEAKAVANHACLQACEMMYRVGGAGMTARKYNFDRHWRNARTHTTHDPVAYKYRAIGDFYLNGRPPPISTKI